MTPSTTPPPPPNPELKPGYEYACDPDIPSDDPDNGVVVVAGLPLGSTLELRFYGANTPGTKKTLVRLWLLTDFNENEQAEPAECEIYGEWVGDMTLTFGSKQVTSNVLPGAGSDSRWAKEIAVTKDRTLLPGIRQTGQGDLDVESVPTMQLDSKGAVGFVIQMIREVASDTHTFGFSYRVF